MKTKIHYGNKVSTVKGNTVYFAIRNWNYLTTEVRYSPVYRGCHVAVDHDWISVGDTCGCSTSLVCSTGSIGEQSPSPVRLLERTTRGHYALH